MRHFYSANNGSIKTSSHDSERSGRVKATSRSIKILCDARPRKLCDELETGSAINSKLYRVNLSVASAIKVTFKEICFWPRSNSYLEVKGLPRSGTKQFAAEHVSLIKYT